MISLGTGAPPAPGRAAAAAPTPPAMPKPRNKSKRQPFNLKQDKYHRHGGLLVAAEQSPEALERLLAVLRMLCDLLCDVLRPSSESCDAPIILLGQHYISHRELSGYADGSADRVHIQEIASFDAEEKPRDLGLQGTPLVVFHIVAEPQVKAKSKRLGRELYVKVSLRSVGHIVLPRHNEEYECSLPCLVLRDPLAPTCAPDFKGELTVRCEATGLLASLVFKGQQAAVKGTLEQLSANGYAKVGTFHGHWNEQIHVVCPNMAMEGLVHELGALKPCTSLDLINLGPMQLPRLWSCLHDACMYNDVTHASGGKAAVKLSRDLARRLKGLSYEPVRTRDVAATTAVPGGPAAPPGTETGGGSSSTDDSDFETADIPGPAGDTRAVPPYFKGEKAAGKVLRWQLGYTVVNMPNTFAATQQQAAAL